ncbi:hypothetical protein GALMADRAFT_133099 [Galerina marginata CBS 339.88]|uniref:Uncharacterized protein n=1 Tax=Galerina marginata (strain CBS 339.88) TaxID=685588 RepID=A0A067TKB8_GALM3|nr:hypothetical protein GALMADRAFT_133099 [Galerina marginata CBS 339.88]
MSYRKPPPVYIPSPPPSPPPSTRREREKDAEETQEKQVPPLPDNWREILSAKAVKAKATKALPVIGTQEKLQREEEIDITELSSSKKLPDLPQERDIDEDQESFATAPGSHHLSPHSTHRGRGLPTHYRPPTPPLRSQSKQSRRLPTPADKNSEHVTLYSETHSSPGLYLASNSLNHYANYPRLGAGSLKPTASFRTERTLVSMNTNFSMGWPNGLGNSSERAMHSYPTFLIQKETPDALANKDDASDDLGHCGIFSCWPRICLSVWAQKLRSFVVISK